MNATILNAALAGDRFTDDVGGLLADDLDHRGYEVQSWTLRAEKIAFCLGCFECWTRTPGLCRIDDAGRQLPPVPSTVTCWCTLRPLPLAATVGTEEGGGPPHLPDFPQV